jgi:hypothetical protein
MSALAIWSLMTGSLGLQAIALGTGLRLQQSRERALFQEEEETLTPYDSRETIDPMDDKVFPKNKKGTNDPRLIGWEFKIVRATSDLFREPAMLKRLCEEEAAAGWIMLEKLDDRRIRFKRPIAMREVIRADLLPHDPYRTTYGKSSAWKQWAIAGGTLLMLVLPAYLGFVLITLVIRPEPLPQPQPTSLPSSKP